jgi:transcriptional regulator with XRE-family HTH domain
MLQKAINEYLQANGITQTFVSEKSGITTNALSLMLNGKRKLTADEYIKICDVLKLPYGYFVNHNTTTPTA